MAKMNKKLFLWNNFLIPTAFGGMPGWLKWVESFLEECIWRAFRDCLNGAGPSKTSLGKAHS